MRAIPLALLQMTCGALPAMMPTVALAADLAITIDGVRSDQGKLAIALARTADHFPGAGDPALAQMVAAKEGEVSCVFEGLEPGTYAVSIYHDENDNGELDRNLLGIPTEGYGFGNDATGFMGPPDFADAAVEIRGHSQAISVAINY